ncbi:MAG TPA: hypothetical protein PKD00_03250 [Burkholderiales bacterium]|nr:hypothetical protein [Burkholderiales bacterium]
MENFYKEFQILKNDFKKAKDMFEEIISNIKKEMEDSYFKSKNPNKMKFRFAIMLLTGKYIKNYEEEFSNRLFISPVTDYKSKEYENYYSVLKGIAGTYGFTESRKNIGFICFKKDLVFALRYKMQDIWRFHVSNRYVESLDTFTKDCLDNKLNLLEIYEDYCREHDIELHFIDCPQIKVTDIIISLNFNKYNV